MIPKIKVQLCTQYTIKLLLLDTKSPFEFTKDENNRENNQRIKREKMMPTFFCLKKLENVFNGSITSEDRIDINFVLETFFFPLFSIYIIIR